MWKCYQNLKTSALHSCFTGRNWDKQLLDISLRKQVTGRLDVCTGFVTRYTGLPSPMFIQRSRRGGVMSALVINWGPKVLRTQNLLWMAPTPAPTRVYCFIGWNLMWPSFPSFSLLVPEHPKTLGWVPLWLIGQSCLSSYWVCTGIVMIKMYTENQFIYHDRLKLIRELLFMLPYNPCLNLSCIFLFWQKKTTENFFSIWPKYLFFSTKNTNNEHYDEGWGGKYHTT